LLTVSGFSILTVPTGPNGFDVGTKGQSAC